MADPIDASNAGSTDPDAASIAAPNGNGSAATQRARRATARKIRELMAHPRVRGAVTLAKKHPLGTVAAAGAAAAFVEVPFAVGVLTGLGATALLVRRTGAEARREVLARGRDALARARTKLARQQEAATAEAGTGGGDAGAPPT